jgi:glycerate 2-kinase
MISKERQLLTELFQVAVKAGHPLDAMRECLPNKPKGRVVVVGAGKASAQMAECLEELWDGPIEGIVVGRHGSSATLKKLRYITASHPVPDAAGLAASEALLQQVSGLTEDDLVIALISGGGSALLPAPAAGLTLQDEMDLNTALLQSGAPISVMNGIRKQISRIKGGRLALAAAPARVVSFVVSDIPGDVLSLISSGPTIPDDTTIEDALASIKAYNVNLPAHLTHFIEHAAAAPKPNDPGFGRNEIHLVASSAVSLESAADYARRKGHTVHVLSDAIEGESREVAKMHANIARYIKNKNQPFERPCLILSGGETTVTIGAEGHGKGGRNAEFALSFAKEISGISNIHCLAADTDGIDGSEDNAGAFADGETWNRIRHVGLDPLAHLKGHDSWTALNAAGEIFKTGQTGTNVNDFRAILIT